MAEPARRRTYGRPQPRSENSHYVMACLHPDAWAAVTQLMERHRISASGAVHHLVRAAAGLDPLNPF